MCCHTYKLQPPATDQLAICEQRRRHGEVLLKYFLREKSTWKEAHRYQGILNLVHSYNHKLLICRDNWECSKYATAPTVNIDSAILSSLCYQSLVSDISFLYTLSPSYKTNSFDVTRWKATGSCYESELIKKELYIQIRTLCDMRLDYGPRRRDVERWRDSSSIKTVSVTARR